MLPSVTAKSLGVTLDSQLSYSANIAATTRSCRFLLYNIRRIRQFLTREAAQLLVQALVISRLDYCNVLLAGLPASATRPLQRIQNAAARLVFNQPKFSHVTPLFRSLHWLPISAHIKFKTLVHYITLWHLADAFVQSDLHTSIYMLHHHIHTVIGCTSYTNACFRFHGFSWCLCQAGYVELSPLLANVSSRHK